MTGTEPAIRIPVLPVLALLGSAALALAMLAPLGTTRLPAAGRLLFWAALVGGGAWQCRLWFRLVPPLLPASRAALPVLFVGGTALLAVLLPLEYGALATLSGLKPLLPWGLLSLALLVSASAVATVITVVRWLAVRRDRPARGSDQAV
jgi:hypothetical protein